jgi:hypothetical protein
MTGVRLEDPSSGDDTVLTLSTVVTPADAGAWRTVANVPAMRLRVQVLSGALNNWPDPVPPASWNLRYLNTPSLGVNLRTGSIIHKLGDPIFVSPGYDSEALAEDGYKNFVFEFDHLGGPLDVTWDIDTDVGPGQGSLSLGISEASTRDSWNVSWSTAQGRRPWVVDGYVSGLTPGVHEVIKTTKLGNQITRTVYQVWVWESLTSVGVPELRSVTRDVPAHDRWKKLEVARRVPYGTRAGQGLYRRVSGTGPVIAKQAEAPARSRVLRNADVGTPPVVTRELAELAWVFVKQPRLQYPDYTAEVVFKLSAPAPEIGSLIRYEISGGVQGVDYGTVPGYAFIPAGGLEISLSIQPRLAATDKTLTIRLLPVEGYELSVDTGTVDVLAAAYAWIETTEWSARYPDLVGQFAVRLSDPAPAGGVQAEVAFSGAAAGTDYVAIASPVTIAQGATEALLNVTPLEGLTESKSLTASLSPIPKYIMQATQASVELLHPNYIELQTIDGSAEYPSNQGRIDVVINAPAPDGGVAVTYTAAGATAGVDYTALSGSVTIPQGATSASILIDALITAGDVTLTLTLDLVTDYTITEASASVNITAVEAPLTEAWKAAVTANGGTYTTTDTTALAVLEQTLTTAGLTSKIRRLWPVAGSNLAAATRALIGGHLTSTGFVGGDYARVSGITGGTSKYFTTDYTPNDALGGCVADVLAAPSAVAFVMGVNKSDAEYCGIQTDTSNPRCKTYWGGGAAASNHAGFGTTSSAIVGVVANQRESASSLRVYDEGVVAGTRSGTVGTMSHTFPMLLLARRSISSVTSYFTGRVGFFAIIDGTLSEAEQATLAAAIVAYRTALGRS